MFIIPTFCSKAAQLIFSLTNHLQTIPDSAGVLFWGVIYTEPLRVQDSAYKECKTRRIICIYL